MFSKVSVNNWTVDVVLDGVTGIVAKDASNGIKSSASTHASCGDPSIKKKLEV